MESSFLIQILRTLSAAELIALRKWLHSPVHNLRNDVAELMDLLIKALRNGGGLPAKQDLYRQLFPDKPYDNREFNLIITYLTRQTEQFLAFREWQQDEAQQKLYVCRALHKRGLNQLVERDLQALEQKHHTGPHRHGEFFLFEYRLHGEKFAVQNRQQRKNLEQMANGVRGAIQSVSTFFLVEYLRWLCTAESLRSQAPSAMAGALPMTDAVLAYVAQLPAETNPTPVVMYHCYLALTNPEDEANYLRLKELIGRYGRLFPPTECRDLYMIAINFCIRRHNRGDRHYTREAFDWYREALSNNLLLENGVLPHSTYTNIHNLAHLNGEQTWAREFLDRYAPSLPADTRDNIYRYNLATYHFRQGQYDQVLELLQHTDFPDLFMHLDARKMLLRAYFERGEWLALASLLDSFSVFLRRQKRSGYHLENYRNLVHFVRQLLKRGQNAGLAEMIRNTPAVAERDWLLSKV